MAEIVLGVGSSHGPTMKTPPERWAALGAKDQEDTRFDFAALRANPRPGIEQEVTLEKFTERYNLLQENIERLAEIIRQAKPDVMVVLSNPHGGVAADKMQPTFGIYLNDPPPLTEAPRFPGQMNRSVRTTTPPEPDARLKEARQFPTDGDLARHLMDGLIDEHIDVAASFQSRPGAGLDMAFNLLYEVYDRDAELPYVPVLISRYLPNQATPHRAYEFGQALGRVIGRWESDKRVAIMASGGLSHQILDEELDREVIDALVEGDVQKLTSLDRQRLNRSPGTPEILNWVACAGAMEPRTMNLVDYVPCYRSIASTGHGVTFGYW